MSILRFNDGVSIDTSGDPRVLQLADGYYAVGKGILIPASDYDTASFLVRRMKVWQPGESITKPRTNNIHLQHKK